MVHYYHSGDERLGLRTCLRMPRCYNTGSNLQGKTNDMPCERFDWQTLPREQLSPGLARQFISGEKATVALFHFRKGGTVPAHSHENEQLSYVLEGSLRFHLQDQKSPQGQKQGEDARELDVRAGQVLLILSHVAHSAVALEDTVVLDIFSPIRKDWLGLPPTTPGK